MAFALLAIGTPNMSATHAKTVVLSASGPSAAKFPVGKVLQTPLGVTLAQGDYLKLLDINGTREFAGPTTISDANPYATKAALRLRWDELTGKKRNVFAGPRTPQSRVKPSPQLIRHRTAQDELWLIDPTIGGDWCVKDVKNVMFWRAAPADAANLDVTAAGRTTRTSWAKGDRTVGMPPSTAIEDGEAFVVDTPGKSATISIRTVPLGSDLDELARALATKGCYHQMSMLTDD